MSNQEKIKLKIPTARSKLQSSFPQDQRSDIKIILKKKYVFKLQKAFLRLQSNYFKKAFSPQTSTLQINEDFQEIHFANVLKCFYGFIIQIDRNEVLSYYRIIKFLQIECLLKFLREDMAKNIHYYQLFILMKLGHEYNQQQIFQACFRQLQAQSFQQLNYNKFQLLTCSQQLFKLIIKTHNRMKAETEKGLSYTEIDKIIKEFCSQKNMSEAQYQQMKFQLIDKNSLNSVEYKQIFMDELKNMKKSNIVSQSFIKSPSNNYNFQNSGGLNSLVKTSNLTQSMISQTPPLKSVSTQLTLEMQNTFQKKLNQELKLQNQGLKRQIQILKQASQKNQAYNATLQNSVTKLENSLNIKQQEDKKQKQLILKMEKAIITMRNQLTQKSSIVQKLQQKITKLQKSTNKKYMIDSDQEEEQNTIQSQIVPAHLLNQMMPNPQKQEEPNQVFKKKPPPTIALQNMEAQKQEEQEELDDQDLEQMYGPRLQFTQQPIGTPKKYFPTLAQFLTDQKGWNKKRLTLIYRRSQQGKSFGQSADLKGRKALLFLIKTQYGQYIGGFTSISLPKFTSGDYIQDSEAFLFSLSKNQKFQILKSQSSEAIFMSQSNLISFGNDLTVSENCLKQKSQSSWPSSYSQGKKNSRVQWFLGGPSPFLITQIQCYQVQQAQMEMVL